MTGARAHAHLAQINLGTLLADPDDPLVAPFMDALDRVNAVADAAPGFVWRLQTDEGNATSVSVTDDPRTIANLTVWESVESLKDYVYRSPHVEVFRRRAEWLVPKGRRFALWWVPAGEIPTVAGGVRRLEFLERHGPTPYAFGFAHPQPPLVVETTTPDDPGTAALIARLDAELLALSGNPCENHLTLGTGEVTGGRGVMFRLRLDGELVGCAAVRPAVGAPPGTGELKRMFVDDAYRGQRLGAALLDHAESAAIGLGFTSLRLETSERQPAAIALYEAAGFTRREPWGEYLETPDTSRCYEMSLSA
ncbi:MAG: GNAT family N-acetyltransferase [Acidimicrobiales bacterium]